MKEIFIPQPLELEAVLLKVQLKFCPCHPESASILWKVWITLIVLLSCPLLEQPLQLPSWYDIPQLSRNFPFEILQFLLYISCIIPQLYIILLYRPNQELDLFSTLSDLLLERSQHFAFGGPLCLDLGDAIPDHILLSHCRLPSCSAALLTP